MASKIDKFCDKKKCEQCEMIPPLQAKGEILSEPCDKENRKHQMNFVTRIK